MKYKHRLQQPLFLGLTHIGQVFSVGWSEKIGNCAVFDFNKNSLLKFKQLHVTSEEPKLRKYLKKNFNKITICKSEKEIRNYKNIFLTIDTPLNQNGEPEVKEIKKFITKSIPFIRKNSNLIITSQVYCGFCDDLKKTVLNRREDINLIYMAETLIMGDALSRFINPERLIFGINKSVKFLKELKKFKCPIFFFSYKEAEMVKMAINLFLLNCVTYANAIDLYCRQFGFKFSKINTAIKLDKRIGEKSYISPSLGISGGHLERDLFTITETANSKVVKKFYRNLKELNKKRFFLLTNAYKNLELKNKFKKILWVGPSYKQSSFSIVNSPFLRFRNYLSKKRKKLFAFDSFFDIKKYRELNTLQDLNKAIVKNSLIIINYISNKNFKIIKKKLKLNKCTVIDIRMNRDLMSNYDSKLISILN